MTTDMPTSVGGGNTAPSPGWQLRAAEASCVATLIAMRAAQVGVALAKVEVTVDLESNDWGILGIGDESAGAVPAGPPARACWYELERRKAITTRCAISSTGQWITVR